MLSAQKVLSILHVYKLLLITQNLVLEGFLVLRSVAFPPVNSVPVIAVEVLSGFQQSQEGELHEGQGRWGEAYVQSLFPLRANSEIHVSILFRWCSKKVRDLWWQGIPPSVRGKVWSLAIGNELNITHGEWLGCS